MKSTQRTMARLLSIALVVVQIIGCQSMRTVEESPESVRQGIADGSLLEKGDWVRVYLTSGESVFFQFVRVSEDQIIGHQEKPQSDQTDDTSTYWADVVIPISEVERLERGEFSAGKTTAVFGIPAVLLILLGVAIAAAGPFMP